jgi:outer membrane protein assembly factor BamB
VAFAQPAITVSPETGPPTDKVATSGTGFSADEAVYVYFDTAELDVAATNPEGSFGGIHLTIPAAAVPGKHWITGVGQTSGLAAQTSFIVRTDWAQFHRGPQQQGYDSTENVLSVSSVGGMQLRWSQTISCDDSTPVVANGRVYAGGEAFDAVTGQLVWSAPSVPCICGSCNSVAVSKGVAYVATFLAPVMAFDAATGEPLWTSQDVQDYTTPTVSNGAVYVGGYTGTYALNATTGELRWTGSTGSGQGAPAEADGVVYKGAYDWNVYALDAATGAQLWATRAGSNIQSSVAVADGRVFAGAEDDKLYAFDAASGSVLWTGTTGGFVNSSPAVAEGVVYVGSADAKLYAFNAANGQLLWSTATGGAIYSSPAVANGVVYVGSDDSNVYALDAESGETLWSATSAGAVGASPAVANGMVFATSADKLYAFGLPPARPVAPPDPATLKPDRQLAGPDPVHQGAGP